MTYGDAIVVMLALTLGGACAAAPRRSEVLDVAALAPQLEALYKDLHHHPELRFYEQRAVEARARVKALSFEVTEGVAQTGVVAITHNGAGPTCLLK
ncbi:MAG TPA: hypothetical protein VGN77_07045 [Steroidobacteraceae bacterium]|nr:hypothetical protein [Steroidobacteraceae bacterium]